MRRRVAAGREELAGSAARLDALSPLAVLGRGYAIATDASGKAILDAAEVRRGDAVRVRVHRGSFAALVEGAITREGAPKGDPEGGGHAA
jgi:exodeoxyribonuclease VII large subunit